MPSTNISQRSALLEDPGDLMLSRRGGGERNEREARVQLAAPTAGRPAEEGSWPDLDRPRRGSLSQTAAGEAVDRAQARRALRERLADSVDEQRTNELIDALLVGRRTEAEILGADGLLGELTRRLVERALAAELTEHLGYEHGDKPDGEVNERNGSTPKTLLTDHGPVAIAVPRDRDSTFEPLLVAKHQRRLTGLDEKIIALYAGGMSTREIETYIADLYGPGVSRDTASRVISTVSEDAKAWHTRPLDALYPILYLDAMIVKIRDGGAVKNMACYLAIGVNLDGERDVLGLWIAHSEGAKFWLQVLTDLKTRGVQDVLVCCVDGLTGFPEAIEAVYPKAWVQCCIVHQIRSSMRFVPYKDRRAVAADLKKIYTAVDRGHAETELERFAEKWDARYPMISASWIDHWEQIVPFLAFPPDLRRVVYTTNTIEALNRQIRKIIKTRGSFPTEDSARILMYLTITRAQRKWRHTYNWSSALVAFRIHFGDRVPATAS